MDEPFTLDVILQTNPKFLGSMRMGERHVADVSATPDPALNSIKRISGGLYTLTHEINLGCRDVEFQEAFGPTALVFADTKGRTVVMHGGRVGIDGGLRYTEAGTLRLDDGPMGLLAIEARHGLTLLRVTVRRSNWVDFLTAGRVSKKKALLMLTARRSMASMREEFAGILAEEGIVI